VWLIAVNLIFKWGILGASKFAFEQMAPAIHAAKSNSLVALATMEPFQETNPIKKPSMTI